MAVTKKTYYSSTDRRHRGFAVTAHKGGPLDPWAWCETVADLSNIMPIHEGRMAYVMEKNAVMSYLNGSWVETANRPSVRG